MEISVFIALKANILLIYRTKLHVLASTFHKICLFIFQWKSEFSKYHALVFSDWWIYTASVRCKSQPFDMYI
jgi:hypothetical protein